MRDHYDFSSGEKNPYANRLKKYIELRADKASVENFKYVLPKVHEAEPADSTELEKDMSRTSMNAMWEELKNDTW